MWVLVKIRENGYFVTRFEGVELVYCVNKLESYSKDAVTCIAIREDGYEILRSSFPFGLSIGMVSCDHWRSEQKRKTSSAQTGMLMLISLERTKSGRLTLS